MLLILAVTAGVTWYSRQGSNNPGSKYAVSVQGGAGGYSVVCLSGRDARVVGELRPSAEYEERIRTSEGDVFFKDVYPFADSARAALVTYAGLDILVCDSAILTPRPEGVHSQFREKIELLIIPSAGGETILKARDHFRPRFLAVIPPCSISQSPAQNIICNMGADGKFKYDFVIKGGKMVLRD